MKITNVPPLLVNFLSKDKFFEALDQPTKTLYEAEIEKLFSQKLPPVVSTRILAILFGYRAQFIGAILKRPERYYRTFNIRKGKGARTIRAPKVALKIIQRWLAHHLSQAITLPEYVVGFVPCRSTFDGALPHCKANWLFSTDIEEFFPSTSQQLVTTSLQNIGYSDRAATLIASLSSINGGLAQGSPCSPFLSNLAFGKSDAEIARICSERGYKYSRYADDISISGLGEPPTDLAEIIKNIVSSSGWAISAEKTKIVIAPKRMKVFGLVVNGPHPVLTKGYRNRIRAIRHLRDSGKLNAERISEGLGHISYAESIEHRIEKLKV